MMEDSEIVSLYLERDESALSETEKKYSAYLLKIAYNILSDYQDAQESVNDTYLKAWNSIPPSNPRSLSLYLVKIVRENSIDIYRKHRSKKRYFSGYVSALSEIEETAIGEVSVENEADYNLLGEKINEFLRNKSDEMRNIFICRYYFCDSIKDIAKMSDSSEAKIKSSLYRMRTELKEFLRREGVII